MRIRRVISLFPNERTMNKDVQAKQRRNARGNAFWDFCVFGENACI